MIRILQSTWLTALVGCMLYLGTTLALVRPDKFVAAKKAPSQYSADDDPSWKFKNPEFNQWVAQMKDEKEALALREQQLNEWQARLEAERREIEVVTQTVAGLQSDFDRNVVRFRAEEVNNVRHQAKLIAAMSPNSAAALFKEMNDDDVVRILFSMKIEEASVVLETMSKLGEPEAKRAGALTARLHQVLPPDTNAVTTTTTP